MTRHLSLWSNGYAVARDLHPKLIDVDRLRPLGRDTRKHPPGHIRKLKASIEQFGFVLPIVIDEIDRVVAGWGLVLAAAKLGLRQVPAVTLSGLGDAELRMLRLALNRLGEDSSWDVGALALEFSDILELDGEIDLQITGFEMGEIDGLLDGNRTEDGQAGSPRGRCNPGLFGPAKHRSRSLRRRWLDLDRGRENRPQSPADRDRPAIRRRHGQAVAAAHGWHSRARHNRRAI